MEDLAVALPGLLCAAGMALPMWLMIRKQSRPAHRDRTGEGLPETIDEQLGAMRREIARLRAEHARRREDRPPTKSID